VTTILATFVGKCLPYLVLLIQLRHITEQKICPKLPHNSSFTFTTRPEGNEKGF